MTPNIGCSPKEKLYYAAPTLPTKTERKMETPGFWISHHPFPDKIILKPKEIESLNSYIENELKLTKDVAKLGFWFSAEELISSLEDTLSDFHKRGLYQRIKKI
jgi:hypothetical protein